MIRLVIGYQKAVEGRPSPCRFTPSCSAYAIEALEALKMPCKVDLHTDSKYLQDGVTKWIHAWKARGWKTADKKPVKNEDLWKRLDQARLRHEVDWRWVKGHAGDVMNERADGLARKGLEEARRR